MENSLDTRFLQRINGHFYKPIIIGNDIRKNVYNSNIINFFQIIYDVALMSDVITFALRDEYGNEYGAFTEKQHLKPL
jgi:hypothetical protein